MVNAEKHRQLKENPVHNWNIEKRKNYIRNKSTDLNSFVNLQKQNRKDLKAIEQLKI